MTAELFLRRKWTLRAHGRQIVFVKKPNERTEHVVMKAFLWALYLPEYTEVSVELEIGDRYKPDVISFGPDGRPAFWGEAGEVSAAKIRSLGRRYRETHFAIGKWDVSLDQHRAIVDKALDGLTRTGPFDLIAFPADSIERFVTDEGEIRISHADVAWQRIEPS